jgi:RND family efflux transporter MFP subunit
MAFDQNALDSLRIERSPPTESESGGNRRPLLWIAAGVVALIAIVWAVFALRTKPVEVETATATPVASGTANAVLDGSGYVVARRQATVSSKVTGKIEEVLIEEGMSVKEGQLLARLDDSSVRPQYLLAQRQLDSTKKNLDEVRVRHDQAERDLNRNQQLREQKLVSQSALESAQAEASAQAARLAALESSVSVAEQTVKVRAQDLADLEIRAPFAGVVVSKDAQPGEIISPMSAGGGFTRTGVATLVDMDSREIEVDVNEAFINRVHDKQKTEAVLDAYPDWRIKSHVINIVPTADRQKATVRVRIGFDELDPRIMRDMGVKVHFLEDAPPNPGESSGGGGRAAARIPTTALVQADGKTYVWAVRDGKAERVAVSASQDHSGTVDINAGLASGDVVVAKPVPELHDGVKVKIKQQ